MKLFDLVSVLDADMNVHVMTVDDSVYFGKIRYIYNEVDETATVSRVFIGFWGLCIEIAKD